MNEFERWDHHGAALMRLLDEFGAGHMKSSIDAPDGTCLGMVLVTKGVNAAVFGRHVAAAEAEINATEPESRERPA